MTEWDQARELHGLQPAPAAWAEEMDAHFAAIPPFEPDKASWSGSNQQPKKPVHEYAPLAFVSPQSLQNQPIPDREWVVPGWMPLRTVTLHYAAGGEGKTLVAQQLMTSVATGQRWLGLIVNPCRAIGLFCEDDETEMHRRQDAINRAYGVEFQDLEDMRWSCPVGDDNTLVRFEADGMPVFTERFDDFRKQAMDFGAGLVVLDVAADLFGGNENIRQQVTAFLKTGLGSLARDLNAAVLLNAHPSRAGISSGDLDGGSTGWNGAARSRWALVTPKGEEGEPVDMDARLLKKMKANYSTRGDELKLRYVEGVLHRDGQVMSGMMAGMDKMKAQQVFLDLLAKMEPAGLHVSASRNAGNYAPREFGRRPDRQGFTKRDFEFAMSALFTEGRLRVEGYGRPSDNTKHIIEATGMEAE